MQGIAQLAIAFGALGFMLAFMGLFPGVTGLEPGRGVGLVQFAVIYIGFILLIIGALTYVKVSFYAGRASNLGQQVGSRLALTGLLFAGIAGMADFLGFGSHTVPTDADNVFGYLQAGGVMGSFVIAAIGVLIYAIMGGPPEPADSPPN